MRTAPTTRFATSFIGSRSADFSEAFGEQPADCVATQRAYAPAAAGAIFSGCMTPAAFAFRTPT